MFVEFPENRAEILQGFELGTYVVLHERSGAPSASEPFDVMSVYSFEGDKCPRGVHPLMADRHLEPDTPELRARWGNFAWTEANAAQAKVVVARYPEGRSRSAVMPLLDLAQRQVGAETDTQGWLPIPVMEYVATYLDMPIIRVVEVATFYTMYNLVPVGKFHVRSAARRPACCAGRTT
jgi:hypothetical protein